MFKGFQMTCHSSGSGQPVGGHDAGPLSRPGILPLGDHAGTALGGHCDDPRSPGLRQKLGEGSLYLVSKAQLPTFKDTGWPAIAVRPIFPPCHKALAGAGAIYSSDPSSEGGAKKTVELREKWHFSNALVSWSGWSRKPGTRV